MTTPSSELRSTGVDAGGLLLRMLVGFIFFMHGYQKLSCSGWKAPQLDSLRWARRYRVSPAR